MKNSNKKLLDTKKQSVPPKVAGKPVKQKVTVDESARLREIRALVANNNRSTIDNDIIICQIWMESTFDKYAGTSKATVSNSIHDAQGLMQVQSGGVKQVYKYRLQKQLGHMPSDKATQIAFAEGRAFYNSGQLLDEASNIQIGTEYMQYFIETSDSIEEAYRKYRGNSAAYYGKIKPCANKLKKDPNNVQILHEIH